MKKKTLAFAWLFLFLATPLFAAENYRVKVERGVVLARHQGADSFAEGGTVGRRGQAPGRRPLGLPGASPDRSADGRLYGGHR